MVSVLLHGSPASARPRAWRASAIRHVTQVGPARPSHDGDPGLEDPGDQGRKRPYKIVDEQPDVVERVLHALVVDDVMRYVGAFLPATITTPDWTLPYRTPEEPVELYARDADPGQSVNLASERSDIVMELRDRYLELLRSTDTADEFLSPRSPR